MPITPKIAALLAQVLPVLVLALVIDLRRVRQPRYMLRLIRFMGAISGLGVTLICIEIAAFPDNWRAPLPLDIFVTVATLMVFVSTTLAVATMLYREEDKYAARHLHQKKHKSPSEHPDKDDKGRD